MANNQTGKQNGVEVIILAAGMGTRMKSEIPKVLHRVCEYPMLQLLLQNIEQSGIKDLCFNIVVGHKRDLVVQAVEKLQTDGKIKSSVSFTTQEQQLGTGHAVKLALGDKLNSQSSSQTVLVMNGDLPMFSSESVRTFLHAHEKAKSVASLASTSIEDAGSYGRVLRKNGKFIGVVEAKDASKAQLKVKEYNGGVYAFNRNFLISALKEVKNQNAAGEFYLPDVFSFAVRKKKIILAHHLDDHWQLAGVNNMRELAEVQKEIYYRVCKHWMTEGVFIAEPRYTYIGLEVNLSRGCQIGPFSKISGVSVLAEDVKVGAHCDLNNVVVGRSTLIRNATVAEKVTIGADCSIGPFVHMRPGSELANKVRVGNFVEIKQSKIGSQTNAAHLSYIGDALIGENVNLGCGFITCNYDGLVRNGRRKHETKVGNNVFIGSDCQLVAPIEIADGTFIASGSTITDGVKEKESFAIARSKQVTKPGYAKKYKTKE